MPGPPESYFAIRLTDYQLQDARRWQAFLASIFQDTKENSMTENSSNQHALTTDEATDIWDEGDGDTLTLSTLDESMRDEIVATLKEAYAQGVDAGKECGVTGGGAEIKAADVRKGDVLRRVERFDRSGTMIYPDGVAAKRDSGGDWIAEDGHLLTYDGLMRSTTYLISGKPIEHPDPETHKLIHARRVEGDDLVEPNLLVAKGASGYFSLTNWRWYSTTDIEDFEVVEVKAVSE